MWHNLRQYVFREHHIPMCSLRRKNNNSRKYRDAYNDVIIVKILHSNILWNCKILPYINQNYYRGIDISSQKPGSSGMKPGTGDDVCSQFLAFASLLWEAGKATPTCGHNRNNLERKSLFLTSFSLPVSSWFLLRVQNPLLFLLLLWSISF